MEDDKVGDKELLMAWSDKGCRKICGQVWYVSEDEKKDKGISREVEVEWDTREAVNTSDGRLHYKVAVSSWKEYDPSGLQ